MTEVLERAVVRSAEQVAGRDRCRIRRVVPLPYPEKDVLRQFLRYVSRSNYRVEEATERSIVRPE
jgi:hypothetical protein